MSAHVAKTKEKVQKYLTDFLGNISLDRDGNFHFQHGSSHIFVRIRGWNDENTLVSVIAPTNSGIPPSPELFEHIATTADNYVFGHLSATKSDDSVSIMLSHNLLGEYLERDELKLAISGIALSADDVDNKIQDLFGGNIFHEE